MAIFSTKFTNALYLCTLIYQVRKRAQNKWKMELIFLPCRWSWTYIYISIYIYIYILQNTKTEARNVLKYYNFFFQQALGEDLITVLDQLRIKYCIGIGDGAGANIITRFGMMHVTRWLIIIHFIYYYNIIFKVFSCSIQN